MIFMTNTINESMYGFKTSPGLWLEGKRFKISKTTDLILLESLLTNWQGTREVRMFSNDGM